jgi:hypothetical protein
MGPRPGAFDPFFERGCQGAYSTLLLFLFLSCSVTIKGEIERGIWGDIRAGETRGDLEGETRGGEGRGVDTGRRDKERDSGKDQGRDKGRDLGRERGEER